MLGTFSLCKFKKCSQEYSCYFTSTPMSFYMKEIFIIYCISIIWFLCWVNCYFLLLFLSSVKPENKVTCNWWLLTADVHNLLLENVKKFWAKPVFPHLRINILWATLLFGRKKLNVPLMHENTFSTLGARKYYYFCNF